MYGFFGERLAGTEDIRSSGAVSHVMRELGRHHGAWLSARRGATVGTSTIYSATAVTFAVGTATAFAVGGSLWLAGAITLGTVYLLFYYTELLRRPIEQIRRELEDMQQAFASIARVNELLRIRSRLRDGTSPLRSGALDVELKAHVGHLVEVTGSVKISDDKDKSPTFKVETSKMISDNCTASPSASAIRLFLASCPKRALTLRIE